MSKSSLDYVVLQKLTLFLFLDTARKTRALWLLQHSPDSVEAIAAQLGYAGTFNFSRKLRRWFGLTPRELRRQGAAATG